MRLFLIFLLIHSVSAYLDSEIFENDLAKQCRPLDRNLDLMFLLDGSGSTTGNTFETQLDMVRKVVNMVDIGLNATRVALLQYSGYTRVEFDFDDYASKAAIHEALDNVKLMSGTTRAAKAIRRALISFSKNLGARRDSSDVAKVAVVVSDGHSIDNPIPASEEMRSQGIILLAMGIGSHINMAELREMSGDPSLAFTNGTMREFASTFRKIAIGEKCEFAKGVDGAEIVCNGDSIMVNTMTEQPFRGHLYVPGHFGDPDCSVPGFDRSISLRIPMKKCGVQEQFLFKPRGLLVETAVILKYHPHYNMAVDRTFKVRCFYPEENYEEGKVADANFAFHGSVGNPLRSDSHPKMEMPCAYTMRHPRTGCILENLNVGDAFVHHWECDKGIIGEDVSMLVHSCYLTDGDVNKVQVVDERGCSLDQHIIQNPRYDLPLKVTANGASVKFSDISNVQYHCSLKFCSRSEGGCESLLPPQCGAPLEENAEFRQKRDALHDFGNMPQYMVQRLFMRRMGSTGHGSEQIEAGSDRGVVEILGGAGVIPTTPVGTLATDRLGHIEVQTLRPYSRFGLASYRSFRPYRLSGITTNPPRRAFDITPEFVGPRTRVRNTEPPTTSTQPPPPTRSTTEPPTTTQSTTTPEPTTTTVTPEPTVTVTPEPTTIITPEPTLPPTTVHQAFEKVINALPREEPVIIIETMEEVPPQLPFYENLPVIADPIEENQSPAVQELNANAVVPPMMKRKNVMEVKLESQLMMVHDRDLSTSQDSPANWCPRHDGYRP